jgi:hypothetical protein
MLFVFRLQKIGVVVELKARVLNFIFNCFHGVIQTARASAGVGSVIGSPLHTTYNRA